MGVRPEQIAAIAFREWMLMQLPAKVAEINLLRAASLKSPLAGPFTIPAGGTLGVSTAFGSDAYTTVTPTSGVRTAAQLATDVNSAVGSAVAGADAQGRFTLTSLLPPTASTPSAAKLRGSVTTDINALLGFNKGGQRAITTALVAPGHDDVIDGLPQLADLVNRGAGTIVIILGDKTFKPVSANVREEFHLVNMDVAVMRIEPQQQIHRNREHIYASVRCVHELLLSNSGRRLGRELAGDVFKVNPGVGKVTAKPMSFGTKDSPNPLFDTAMFNVEVKVFERPTA